MSEPRTHYQISLTARQALGLFVALLVALGLAYFFGLMTGLSGREGRGAPEAPAQAALAEPTAAAPAAEPAVPPVETGVPVAVRAPAGNASTPPPAEPTVPATLQTFEDGTEGEGNAAAASAAPGSRTTVVGAPAPAPARAPAAKSAAPAPAPAAAHASPAGKVWVQAASLSSADEANALGARLSRHGFHAVVQPGSGPRGRVYRVRVGPYRSEDEASKAVDRLTRQEKIHGPWIVPEGK
ncbi:MAG: SPOR domain-containing protein [Syntrophomonadaceae bacterium]